MVKVTVVAEVVAWSSRRPTTVNHSSGVVTAFNWSLGRNYFVVPRGIPTLSWNHMGNPCEDNISVSDTLPKQRSLTPENFDVTGVIWKCQIVVNVPELLYFVSIA